MAITVKHTKVSTVADDADTSLVRPSDWNADHALSGVGTMAEQNANNVNITGGSISGTTVSGYIPTTEKGAALGVATLDAGGKVPNSQIPLQGDLNYQGTWNANTNTPTLTSSVGTKGYYYVVDVAGTTNLNGITDWQIGDWAIFNGTVWQKVDNTDAVTSVNGQVGTVVLTAADVGAQPAGTYVTSVGATSPVTSTGGTTPTIAMPAANSTTNGYLTSTDWNTFNTISTGGVVGPASATDNAIARYDGTTGKLIQNSTVTLDDNGNIINANSVGLDTTPATVPTAVGTMSWDDGDGVPTVQLKGGNVNLQIGTQEYARVFNDSGTTLTRGQVVYISGSQGNRVAVKLARADVEATSFGTIGLVAETMANGAEGFIIVSGALYKLNTTGLTAGATVYVSPTTAGALTTTKPQAPDQLVVVGWVERVDNIVGSIYVKVDNGYELDELHDVRITSPQSGNVLIYDASTSPIGVWKNANLTDGTGISITEGAGSVTITNTGVTALSAGTGISVSGSTGSVTVTNTDTGSAQNIFKNVAVSGQNTIVADSNNDTLTVAAGTGISLTTNDGTDTLTVTNSAPDQTVSLTGAGTTTVTGTYPNFTITSNDQYTGTVTSVSALTLGTTGTDLSSTVANSTTTPVITLNVPTASATNRGALSSTDWSTFNNKVTSVSGTTGRITSSGGTTPAIDLASGIVTAGTTGSSTQIPVITVDTYGRVTNVTTASNPQGTVTSVSGTGTVNGISLSGTVTSSGSLTLGGTLSGVDLTTQVTGTLPVGNGGTGITTLTANRIPYGNGTSAFQSSANLTFNGTTLTANDIRDTSLTAGRVTYAGTGGNLTDSAAFTYSNTGLKLSVGTAGTALTGINQNNTNEASISFWSNNVPSPTQLNDVLVGMDSTANGGGGFLWNRNNSYLKFGTNNTERGRFSSTGQFGLGTASFNTASTRIQLGGQTGATTTPYSQAFSQDYSSSAATATSCKIFFYYDTANKDVYGLGVGPNADMIYHAAQSGGAKGQHKFYVNEDLALHVIANGSVLKPKQPCFMVGINSNTDITVNNGTYVAFNSVVFDTTSSFNTSTNRFVAPTAGRYFFCYSLFFTGSGGATFTQQAGIYVNGAFVNIPSGDAYGVCSFNPSSAVGEFSCGVTLNLAVGDTVGVTARTSSIRIYQGHSNFTGWLIG